MQTNGGILTSLPVIRTNHKRKVAGILPTQIVLKLKYEQTHEAHPLHFLRNPAAGAEQACSGGTGPLGLRPGIEIVEGVPNGLFDEGIEALGHCQPAKASGPCQPADDVSGPSQSAAAEPGGSVAVRSTANSTANFYQYITGTTTTNLSESLTVKRVRYRSLARVNEVMKTNFMVHSILA